MTEERILELITKYTGVTLMPTILDEVVGIVRAETDMEHNPMDEMDLVDRILANAIKYTGTGE